MHGVRFKKLNFIVMTLVIKKNVIVPMGFKNATKTGNCGKLKVGPVKYA